MGFAQPDKEEILCVCGRHDVTDMDFRHNETVHRRDKCATWWVLKIYDLEARLIEADKLIEQFYYIAQKDWNGCECDECKGDAIKAYETYKQSTKDK